MVGCSRRRAAISEPANRWARPMRTPRTGGMARGMARPVPAGNGSNGFPESLLVFAFFCGKGWKTRCRRCRGLGLFACAGDHRRCNLSPYAVGQQQPARSTSEPAFVGRVQRGSPAGRKPVPARQRQQRLSREFSSFCFFWERVCGKPLLPLPFASLRVLAS